MKSNPGSYDTRPKQNVFNVGRHGSCALSRFQYRTLVSNLGNLGNLRPLSYCCKNGRAAARTLLVSRQVKSTLLMTSGGARILGSLAAYVFLTAVTSGGNSASEHPRLCIADIPLDYTFAMLPEKHTGDTGCAFVQDAK